MFNRLLITGAAGGLGKVLRKSLAPHARTLRLADLQEIRPVGPNEETMRCDLGDADEVSRMMEGVDAVVHLGGISGETAFEPILNANIVGVFNLYQAARRHGVKRIVFASSNHVVGFYPRDQRLDTDVPLRPDSLYGVSKGFGEMLSRFFYDRYGIETVCVRIGSCFDEPTDRRMLSTYLSYGDLTELMYCALTAADVGHTVVYGVSDNSDAWWDNAAAAHLGYQPRDSADPWREALQALPPPAADDAAELFQGGRFVTCNGCDE